MTRPIDVHLDHDFAILGGGPAGAAAAITLAGRGHRVILFERDRHPRFHIGESLLSTANDSFAHLGLTAEIAAAGFPEKWGASLLTHDGRAGRGVDFGSSREIATPRTFQVERAEFDRLLVDRARTVGVDVRQEHRVGEVDFAGDAVRVDWTDAASGRAGSTAVRAVVDATGRAGLLARQFDLRVAEPGLANVAIYAHYAGVPLLEGRRSGDIRIVARDDAGWFWLIPIGDDLMSVGVVLPLELYLRQNPGDPEELLARAIADTPAVAGLMAHAVRRWPVRVEKDFSYAARAYAGDRWLLAGDAGAFLDPVFSTGVAIALESGIEAGEALDRAFARRDFSAHGLRAFAAIQRRRFAVYREFVVAFYTPEFRDLFFQPGPPPRLFAAVVTVLAGRWRPSLATRLLVRVFFALVRLQSRFRFAEPLARRDADAGYPREASA